MNKLDGIVALLSSLFKQKLYRMASYQFKNRERAKWRIQCRRQLSEHISKIYRLNSFAKLLIDQREQARDLHLPF